MEQVVDRIDTLINNAGVFMGEAFTDYTLDNHFAITARKPCGSLPHRFTPLAGSAKKAMSSTGSSISNRPRSSRARSCRSTASGCWTLTVERHDQRGITPSESISWKVRCSKSSGHLVSIGLNNGKYSALVAEPWTMVERTSGQVGRCDRRLDRSHLVWRLLRYRPT